MKNLLLLFLLTLFTSILFSQNEKGWEIGLDAGFNLSKFTGKYSDTDDTKNKFIGTPAVGIKTAYNLTSMIAITAGFYLMKTGGLYFYTNQYENTVYEIRQRERFTTLRIPVAARFTWGKIWQYYGSIGFYMSYKLCGKYVVKVPDDNYEQSGKIIFKEEPENYQGDDWYLSKDDYKRLNVGLEVGGGVRREIGPGYIGVNATFGYGFCDFYKWDDKNDKPDGYKPYMDMNIAFMVTYVILLNSMMN